MKKLLASSIIFSILIFAACTPQQVTGTLEVRVTLPSPTETPTPLPTPSPESLLPQEVKEKFETAGIDLKDMQNAKYDKNGLSITLESGEVVFLTNEELEKNIFLGQDNVLQYRDESNQNVIYAFDPENKTFLEASKYIQKDNSDPEKYIQVANWDELNALWAKEKMFLIPFDPENTYFPPSDEIYRNYDAPVTKISIDEQIKYKYPFGMLPEGMDSPFRFVNFTRMQKDATDGRSNDVYVISQQVFNPSDGTFSVLHFYYRENNKGVRAILDIAVDKYFLLPTTNLGTYRGFYPLNEPYFNILIKYYEINKLIGKNGQLPIVEELVDEWFNTSHVTKKLENILLWGNPSLITGDY